MTNAVQWKPYYCTTQNHVKQAASANLSVHDFMLQQIVAAQDIDPVHVMIISHESKYLDSGLPYYRIYPDMTEALVRTRITIPWSLVQLPFPVFVLQWPVAMSLSINDVCACSVLCAGLGNVRPSHFDSEHLKAHPGLDDLEQGKHATKDLDSIVLIPSSGQPPDRYDKTLSIVKRSDETIQQSIDRIDWETPSDVVCRLFSLVIGTALLATGGHKHVAPDVLSKDLRDYLAARGRNNEQIMNRLTKKAYNKRKTKGFTVGRDYFLPLPYLEQQGEASDSTGRHLSHSHIRCGHWHVVRHGIRRMLSKAVWYEPTLVRPDLEPEQRQRAYAGELSQG